jgi:glycosyltransferase involved in cell wall biosynthesis
VKKVLLLSYFYPPANFVGAERTAAWAKYLLESGIYPIIITRQWNDGQTDIVGKVNKPLEIEKNSTHEVHRLPYPYTLRDRCSKYKLLKQIQKLFTLWELVFSNFTIKALSYSNFYSYAKNLLKNNPDITIVIVSGRPFHSFSIGSKLKQLFPYLHWIPDYRDEWNTHQNLPKKSFLEKLVAQLEKKSEKKWLKNATFFISVSDYWVKRIEKFTNKKGKVVLNGFTQLYEELPDPSLNKNTFVITYAGSLYESQPIEVFLSAVDQLLLKDTSLKLHVRFIGINGSNTNHSTMLDTISEKNKEHFQYLPRLSKEELLAEIKDTDVLLATSFKNVKGWYPVKLFEYFSWNRPILLVPSDADVMESFIRETKSGYICNSSDSCIQTLLKLIELKKENGYIPLERDTKASKKYSRHYQTQQLGTYLNKLK